ncbi:smoothelin-like 1 [Oncorhynchus tshawytscha]|uniref:smoothelin-like 1 n=1 Tax=Oncorhynchus tshawytscha TaxID=74940 RepID=UPI001C3DD619|nr:smoothelin-like 1 [Oncorhynchus tshawytscha]
MDDVSLRQDDSGKDVTANQTEDNKNNQTEREASVQECDPPKRDHLAEDTVEGHVVKSGANTGKAPDQAAGASVGNVEESQPVTDAIEVNGEEACKGEGTSQGADTGETEDSKVVNGEKKGEGEMEADKNRKGQEVVKNGEIEKEDVKEDKEKGGENIARKKGKGEKIGEGKTEEKIKGDKGKDRKGEAGKGEGENVEAGNVEAGKGEAEKGEAGKGEGGKGEGEGDGEGEGGKAPENKSKPVKEKEGAGGGKVKEKSKEVEKQGKTKRKSGVNHTASTPSSVARPRSSARSARPSTKKDIIAKFQKNDSETPVVCNFKLQRSSMAVANGGSIKQKVLSWCQNKTRKYEGVTIENFSSSWCDGLAFCALIHRFFPDAFDFSALSSSEREKNFTLAFNTAEYKAVFVTMADCCPLLEVGDMILMGNSPDPMCVFTYVQALCHHLSKIEKERKDKEEEEKKSEKMKDEEVETTAEKKEEESEETGKIDGQQEEGDEGRENKVKGGKENESEESSAVEREQEGREVRGLIEAQA